MPGPGPSIERATEIIPLPIPTLPWPTPKAELCSYPQCLTGIPLLLDFLTSLGLPGAFDWLRPCPVQFSPTGISGALYYFSRVGSQCSANLSNYLLSSDTLPFLLPLTLAPLQPECHPCLPRPLSLPFPHTKNRQVL